MKVLRYFQVFSGISLVICSLLLVTGCSDDFLDRPPLGSLDNTTWINTEDAGSKMLSMCYTPMLSNAEYQMFKFEFFDCITDDMHKGGSDAADKIRITEIARGNPLPSTLLLERVWNHRLQIAISRCNVLLQNVTLETPLIQAGGAYVSTEEKARWIAEAHFLRAFYYFDLMMIFANVPIIEESLNVIDKTTITKAPMEEVYDFIMKDLEVALAEENLPSAKELSADEFGRVTREAVYSFRARVALFNKDYALAKSDCKKVIDSGAYELIPNYEDLFNSVERGYMSKECIFMTYTSYNPPYCNGNPALIYFVGRGVTGGWGGEVPTYDLVNEYEVKDPRKVHTILSHGDIFPKKDGNEEVHDYTGYDNFTKLQSRKHYVDHFRRPDAGLKQTDWSYYHIRYADVLLMYAESLIELGENLQEAVDVINKVRERAFLTTSPTDSYATYRAFNIIDPITKEEFEKNYKVKIDDDLRKAVRHERRVELAAEGLRYYDLMRWGIFVEKIRAFYKTPEGIATEKGSNISENTWPYPIPQAEIDKVGGALVQNDNYK